MLRKYKNDKINDVGMRLIFIPFCTLLSIFFVMDSGPPEVKTHFYHKLILTFLITTMAWHVGRYVVLVSRRFLPGMENIRPRITAIFLADMTISFFAFNTILFLYVRYVEKLDYGFWDCMFINGKQTIFLTMIFSLLISAIYECIFFFDEWKTKVQEVEKYKKASLEAQYQNLKSQLKPHFLFNSFNTLARLIEENRKKAMYFLQEFSDVYRYVLSSQENNWVLLKDELEFVKSYVFLMKMRHEHNLDVKYNIDKACLHYYVPPLTLQILVENAIKHNEISNDFPLFINISAGNGQMLTVENNINPKVQREASTQVGLKNICERYQLLSDAKVNIENGGGSFKVSVPLLKIESHERVDH